MDFPACGSLIFVRGTGRYARKKYRAQSAFSGTETKSRGGEGKMRDHGRGLRKRERKAVLVPFSRPLPVTDFKKRVSIGGLSVNES